MVDRNCPIIIEMKRRDVLLGIGGGLAMATTGCGSSTASYRFRMTVEAETSQGLRTGSSVMEIRAGREFFRTSETGEGHSDLIGEAVMVDLPDGPVFALLTLGDGAPVLQGVVTEALVPGSSKSFEAFLAAVKMLGSAWFPHSADLPHQPPHLPSAKKTALDNSWPMIVRFGDINNPMSVAVIDPDLIKINRITIATTSDEITNKISKSLKWLPKLHGGYLHRGFTSRGSPFGLSGNLFSTGIK